MEFGYFSMPSHPPERDLKQGWEFDLQVLRWHREVSKFHDNPPKMLFR